MVPLVRLLVFPIVTRYPSCHLAESVKVLNSPDTCSRLNWPHAFQHTVKTL